MLLSFTLENYRSFKEKHKVICIPNDRLSKYSQNIQKDEQCSYLKVVSIYGANASGKSNIIKALKAMRNLLCYEKDFDKVLENAYEPFAYNESMKDKPTYFEIELLLNSKIVKYSIAFNNERVFSESLDEYVDNKYVTILSYSDNGFSYNSKYSDYTSSLIKDMKQNKDMLNKVKELDIQNILESNSQSDDSLSKIDVNNILQYITESVAIQTIAKKSILKFRGLINVDDKVAVDIQKWFINKVIVLDIQYDNIAQIYMKSDYSFGEMFLEDKHKQNKSSIEKNLKSRIINFISGADLSIKYIYSKMKSTSGLARSYDFFSQHSIIKKDGTIGTTSMQFFQHESMGTQRLFSFVYHIIRVIDGGGLLLVDELDRSIHPLIVSYIVQYFNSKDTNPKGGQLIFTTHASDLLRICKLRLDQILFVSKNSIECSDIYPMYKYKKETDEPQQDSLADEYLFGKFGAIPILPSGYNFGE